MSYEFSNILSCYAISGGATEQYCHARGSGVTAFFMSETPSIVTDFVAPMHMARNVI
jgi:hypothetical protein